MSVSPNDRRPKSQEIPSRQIKTGGDPVSFEKETIAWQFNRLDQTHELWGWDKLKAKQWKILLKELVGLEGLTWAKLKEQAGGRRQGTNHHSLEMNDFCKSAKDRLSELNLDQFETLFSIRLNNTLRVYGVRDGRVMQLVWHDPHHGSKNGCYPTRT